MLRKRILCLDTETTGLNVWSPKVRVTHISWFDSFGKGDVYETDNPEHQPKIERLKQECRDSDTTILHFNSKFDMGMLLKTGFRITSPIIDVLLVAQLTKPDEKAKKLKQLVRKFLNDPFLEDTVMRKWLKANPGKAHGEAPRHIVVPYTMKDAKSTLELFYYLMPALDDMHLWAVLEREMALMPIVFKMEEQGVSIDSAKVAELKKGIELEKTRLKKELVKETGNPKFNPNSPKQVVDAVYTGEVMPTSFSRKTGQPKVDELALLESPSKIGSLIVRYRKLTKAFSTYIKPLELAAKTGKLHTNFNQGRARTGRFSSSGPNLQNIPRPDESYLGRIRDCFVPSPGNRLLFADYQQIEMRLAAHFSGQKHMIDAINKGTDLHSVTTKLVFETDETNPEWKTYRYIAKTLNFAILYGAGADKVRETILKETEGKMRLDLVQVYEYIDSYKSVHDKIGALFTKVIEDAGLAGGIVNAYGRFIQAEPYKLYACVNYLIQGTAADFLKRCMFKVAAFLKMRKTKTKLIMTVHDELVFDLHPSEKDIIPILKQIMEDYTTFKVPLTCSFALGKTWLTKKEITVGDPPH